MSKLPAWAKIPKHKETVVATSKGWCVERTGEVLVFVKNLDKKIGSLVGEEIQEAEPVSEIEEMVIEETSQEKHEIEETKEEDQPKKKRGRPKKESNE